VGIKQTDATEENQKQRMTSEDKSKRTHDYMFTWKP